MLVPVYLADTLMRLAEAELYRPIWSYETFVASQDGFAYVPWFLAALSETVSIPGASHALHFDRLEEFATAIRTGPAAVTSD